MNKIIEKTVKKNMKLGLTSKIAPLVGFAVLGGAALFNIVGCGGNNEANQANGTLSYSLTGTNAPVQTTATPPAGGIAANTAGGTVTLATAVAGSTTAFLPGPLAAAKFPLGGGPVDSFVIPKGAPASLAGSFNATTATLTITEAGNTVIYNAAGYSIGGVQTNGVINFSSIVDPTTGLLAQNLVVPDPASPFTMSFVGANLLLSGSTTPAYTNVTLNLNGQLLLSGTTVIPSMPVSFTGTLPLPGQALTASENVSVTFPANYQTTAAANGLTNNATLTISANSGALTLTQTQPIGTNNTVTFTEFAKNVGTVINSIQSITLSVN